MNSKTGKKKYRIPIVNTAHLAALNLIKTDNLLSRAVSKHLSEFGLTISQHGVLAFLQANIADGLALNVLGELLSLSSPNITSVVDRLEEKHLVVRTSHKTDRRKKIIKLTPEGDKLERRIMKIHGKRLREMMGDLEESELETLVQLLRKLRHQLEHSLWLNHPG